MNTAQVGFMVTYTDKKGRDLACSAFTMGKALDIAGSLYLDEEGRNIKILACVMENNDGDIKMSPWAQIATIDDMTGDVKY